MDSTNSSFTKAARILLVGVGQLGSRYLQGLASCKVPIEIWVVDPSEAALSTAKARWKELASATHSHFVRYSTTLYDLPASIDLCLVTTTAGVRLQVVKQVLSECKVRYWVLEKVLAQSLEQINLIEKLLSNADGVWVNTPRRAYSWHQQIYEQLPRVQAWHVIGSGGAWGMACNSIHFIDLVAWWTGEELVSVDASGLEKWFPSKRSGFWEVSGKLKMIYSGGSQLELSADESDAPFSLTLQNQQDSWRLDESVGSFTNSSGFSLPGKVELQSELAGPLVDRILKIGHCSLSTLPESANLHRSLIAALLDYWNVSHQSSDTLLPIT